MKFISPIVTCALIMFATACHGRPDYSKHNNNIIADTVPNIKHIKSTINNNQPSSGYQVKPDDEVEVNLPPTKSPDVSTSQDEIGQQELKNKLSEDELDLIFGSGSVTGAESSTKQFSEADWIDVILSESALYNLIKQVHRTDKLQKEKIENGHYDVYSNDKVPDVYNNLEHGQQGQGFKSDNQNRRPTKNQFGTNPNIPYGFEGNSDVGYNNVGYRSSIGLTGSDQKISVISTTPSSEAGIKGSQPSTSAEYPILRPEGQSESGQSNVRPDYSVFKPVNQDINSEPGVRPNYQINRPENQGGSSKFGVNPTYPIIRPGDQGRNTQPGISPTFPIYRPRNQGGNTQSGLNPTYQVPNQPTYPTYPVFGPENQGSLYRQYIPTAPVGQGGLLPVNTWYWPGVQYGEYYYPNFMPGQNVPGFKQNGWFYNGQLCFNAYPYALQYGWPYTQHALTYGNDWFGLNGQVS